MPGVYFIVYYFTFKLDNLLVKGKNIAEIAFFFIWFSLSLLKTDLQNEQEAKLQDFLIKRLSRSTAYSSSGSLTTLSNSNISEKPVICFYKLIKGPKCLDEKYNNTHEYVIHCEAYDWCNVSHLNLILHT